MSNTNVSFTLTASDKTQAAFASVGNGLGQLKSKSDTLFSAFSGGVAGGLATGLLGAGFTAAITGLRAPGNIRRRPVGAKLRRKDERP